MAVVLDSGITMEVLKRTISAYSLSRLHSGSVRLFLARIRPVLASRCSQEGLATRIWSGGVNSKKPPHLCRKYVKPPIFGDIAKNHQFCEYSLQCALIRVIEAS
jgi:hypothetical protein